MSQLEKNTVKAEHQLPESQYVSFPTPQTSGVRILFAGNSITRHAPKPDIGWTHDWGMAASALDKDYVHQTMPRVADSGTDACACIAQVSAWEGHYADGRSRLPLYDTARAFRPDIIVWRAIENCPAADFDPDAFTDNLQALIDYLNADGHARVIWTTSFWHHPGDDAVRALAQLRGEPLVELGDLGEQDAMKAIGLFAHSGVAAHPGDAGMQEIAARIFAAMAPMLR